MSSRDTYNSLINAIESEGLTIDASKTDFILALSHSLNDFLNDVNAKTMIKVDQDAGEFEIGFIKDELEVVSRRFTDNEFMWIDVRSDVTFYEVIAKAKRVKIDGSNLERFFIHLIFDKIWE